MSETIVISLISVAGVIIASFLSHIIANKEYKLKIQEYNSNNMIELIGKYKTICDDLEKKVNNLEIKVNKLEQENTNLKTILNNNGIAINTIEVNT